jgi:Uma2 family endonuclease
LSDPYEETLEGESYLRLPPGSRHEIICVRLHTAVRQVLAPAGPAKLLATRSIVQISPGTFTRPDLALVMTANARPLLVAEVIEAGDHHADTVLKKQIYEDKRVPRLWMVDPRYNNVEMYHAGPHGLALHRIVAGAESVADPLLPALRLVMNELFAT